MIYDVSHRTRMRYAVPVSDARFNLRLKPFPWPGLNISDAQLTITPRPASCIERSGPYLVNTTSVEFTQRLVELEICSQFRAQVTPHEPQGEGPDIATLRDMALLSRDLSTLSPAPYLFASRLAVPDADIGNWAQSNATPGAPVLAVAKELSALIHSGFSYAPGETSTRTPPREAFAARHGVCQDFAHILIIALRWLGIPSAYASGYLRTIPPPGKPRLVGADAMHAWVNVWCGPDLGWVGIDPTNNRLALSSHIQIAMGRDYADVAPIDGTFVGAAPQKMHSSVDVAPLEPAEI